MTFGNYQLEIYLQGLSGIMPTFPMDYASWEAKAEAAMAPSVWSYVAGGSGDENTQRANRTAFDRWGLMPRMMVGAKERDLTVDLFGLTLPSPVFMAPIGVAGICSQSGHGDLEAALAETVHHYLLVVSDDGRYRFRHALLREAVLADLRGRGLTRILCEGGPSLFAALTAADLVDRDQLEASGGNVHA